MTVDAYRELYEFSCPQCGEIWRATYDVRQVEDERGGVWHHYSHAGAPCAAPAAGVICKNCKQPAIVSQTIDRHRILADAKPAESDEAFNPSEASLREGEEEPSSTQGISTSQPPRRPEQERDPPERMRVRSRIVVGIDGSQGGLRALRWADDEALTKGAELEIVVAWEREVGFGFTGTTSDGFEREVRARTEGHVAQALGRTPSVAYSIAVRAGRPTQVLLERVPQASLPQASSVEFRTGSVVEQVGRMTAEHDIDLIVLSWSQSFSPERALVVRGELQASPRPVLLPPVTALVDASTQGMTDASRASAAVQT